jgi:hypothetical protein
LGDLGDKSSTVDLFQTVSNVAKAIKAIGNSAYLPKVISGATLEK